MSTLKRINFTDGFSSEIVPAESIVSANEFLVGTGVPDNGDGNDGDYFLDADTGDIYLKASGTWSVSQSISLPASQVVNTPAGNIAATDIQSAINELDTEKLDKTGGTITGSLQIDTNLTVTGDLTVNGTTTTIDTDNLSVADSNITINDGGNDATSEGSGLTIERTGTDGSIIYEDAATSKFKVGAVGSEVEVADISSAQDISNKAIIDPDRLDVKKDTKSNLDTYVLTASDGQFCYATDTKTMYQVIDNALTSVGSGGGGLDTFVSESFEVTTSSDLTSGLNVTFDNGGTLGGALSNETISPISGDRSIKYVTNATATNSTNDFFYIPTVTLDPKQKGETVGINLYYTWDGSDDLIEVVIWDDTNDTKLNASTDTLTLQSDSIRYSSSVDIPSTCNIIKIGFHHVGVSESSKTLIFDDVEMSTDPFVYKQLSNDTDWEAYSPTITGFGTESAVDFQYRRNGDSIEVHGKFTSGTSTAVEAQIGLPAGLSIDTSKMSVLKCVGQLVLDGTSDADYTILATGGDSYFNFGLQSPGSSAGLTPSLGTALYGTTSRIISFFATVPILNWTSTTEHVITPAKSNLTDWIAYTPTLNSITGVSTNEAFYRRVGDTIEVSGNILFNGVGDVSLLTIALPSGLSPDSAKLNVVSADSVGVGYFNESGVGFSTMNARMNTTTVAFYKEGGAGSFNTSSVSNADRVSFQFTIPILGWNSDLTFLAAIPTNTDTINIKDGITTPDTKTYVQIFVDTVDGDLKVKFSDGTVKTIVVDT